MISFRIRSQNPVTLWQTMGLFCNHLERKRIVTKTRGTRRLNRMPHFVCVGRCHNAVNRCNGFRIGTETRLCHFGEWKLLELFLRMFLRYTGGCFSDTRGRCGWYNHPVQAGGHSCISLFTRTSIFFLTNSLI